MGGKLAYCIYTAQCVYIYICAQFSQSCPTLCDPIDCSLPGSSLHGDSPGRNTGVGCHALLQGISPTQGSNPGLWHCRRSLYHLSHQEAHICVCVCVCVCIYIYWAQLNGEKTVSSTSGAGKNGQLCVKE